ncbi:MAG: SDR family NAD(P)-dependent oxidoreductase, partial [Salinisphaeraceae bacterium]|nr:SDR family NAD(P)-dependent oxidoreductase [Salinisphaeraceae bacterium]
MQIKDSVFIVTGGASGLGEATVRRLVANGGKAIIADVNEERGNNLENELGDVVKFIKCDVTQDADGRAAVAAAQALGTLRGVVNCAGVGAPAKAVGKDGALPLEKFTFIININLVGTFNLIRLAAEVMQNGEPNEQGERGVFINTASV